MTGRKPEYQEYQTYKRYKKTKDDSTQNILTVFITTFLIMLVFFIGAAKRMTPNVDVTIGQDSTTEVKESGLGVKGFIDNRLKAIQSEDVSNIAKRLEEKTHSTFDEDDEEEYYSKDLEEKVKIPIIKKVKQEVTTQNDSNKEVTKEAKETQVSKPTSAPIVKPNPTVEIPSTVAPTTVKVIVGNYSSIEQAKVAQSILQESNLGVTPFIKNIQGTYTLQVGSFSSEAKAQALVNELLRANFPARMIKN